MFKERIKRDGTKPNLLLHAPQWLEVGWILLVWAWSVLDLAVSVHLP